MYPTLSKSIQSAAGLNAFKPAENGRCLMCELLPYHFNRLYIDIFILLSVKGMLDLFMFS